VKVGYSFTQGHPQVRINMAKKFAEAKGFNLVCEVFKKPDWFWCGSEVLLNILRILTHQEVIFILSFVMTLK
jgi:hypothetical protein